MSSEGIAVLEEELAAARAEVERLEVTAADREARSAHLDEQLSQVREELGQTRGEADAREREVAGLHEQSGELQSQVQEAAQRYRDLALQASPELPSELVTGETVDEVDEALQHARETVSRVRGHLESQAQEGRVPVGAPPRSGPDLSAMSAEDKIRLGLQQRDA